MPTDTRATAILTDGDLPGLVAMAIEAERAAGERDPGPVVVLVVEQAGQEGEDDRVSDQARRVGLSVRAIDTVRVDSGLLVHPETAVLVHAAGIAATRGCGRLVVALAGGGGGAPDIDAVALGLDRAMLVSRLVSLDPVAGAPGLTIERPYDDLSDERLVDLALDLAVPVESVWSGGSSPHAALTPSGRLRRARWAEPLARIRDGAHAGIPEVPGASPAADAASPGH